MVFFPNQFFYSIVRINMLWYSTIILTSGFTVIGDNVSMCSIILKIGKIIILFNGVKETKNK